LCRLVIILTTQGTTTSTPAIIDLTRSEDQEVGYEGDDLDDADFLALEGEQKLATKDPEFNDAESLSLWDDQGLVLNEGELESKARLQP
jgi:hypothetical protein